VLVEQIGAELVLDGSGSPSVILMVPTRNLVTEYQTVY